VILGQKQKKIRGPTQHLVIRHSVTCFRWHESKHVALCDMTLKCRYGQRICICLWYRKIHQDVNYLPDSNL